LVDEILLDLSTGRLRGEVALVDASNGESFFVPTTGGWFTNAVVSGYKIPENTSFSVGSGSSAPLSEGAKIGFTFVVDGRSMDLDVGAGTQFYALGAEDGGYWLIADMTFSDGLGQDEQASGPAASSLAAEAAFEGGSVPVSIGGIGRDGDGNVTVELRSPGIGRAMAMRSGAWAIPAQAAIVVDGERIYWSAASARDDAVDFTFETTRKPEMVIVHGYGLEQDESRHVWFDAFTKEVAR
jgi:hypothetical protein